MTFTSIAGRVILVHIMPYLPFIMFCHFVGDFLCQTRYMAENKSKSHEALLLHILAYGSALLAGMLCLDGVLLWLDKPYHIAMILGFVLMNAALHLATDAITSRITTYFYKKDNKYAFFGVIGFDQFIHFMCLYYTAASYL